MTDAVRAAASEWVGELCLVLGFGQKPKLMTVAAASPRRRAFVPLSGPLCATLLLNALRSFVRSFRSSFVPKLVPKFRSSFRSSEVRSFVRSEVRSEVRSDFTKFQSSKVPKFVR